MRARKNEHTAVPDPREEEELEEFDEARPKGGVDMGMTERTD